MFNTKTIILAKALRPDLNFASPGAEELIWLKIASRYASGNPVRDATIENGIAYFDRVTASQPLVSLKLNLPVTQQGSGTPSPDNIREFIGFSGVNVSRTGKNLLDVSSISETIAGVTYAHDTNGIVILNGTKFGTSKASFPNSQIYMRAGETYTFKLSLIGGTIRDENQNLRSLQCYLTTGNVNLWSNVVNENTPEKSMTVTLEEDVIVYPRFAWWSDNTIITDVRLQMQVERGSEATSYEPYTGNTYQIAFAQTVYSANLDVLTGKLSVTHEIRTIDEDSDITMSNGIVVLDNFFDIDNDTESVNCNVYQRGENRSNTSNVMANNPDYSFCGKNGGYATRLMIKDTRFTTIEDYKTWLANNPVKIAVKLAEPIEIDITPTVINTLIGENVIFADVADVTECKYTRK